MKKTITFLLVLLMSSLFLFALNFDLDINKTLASSKYSFLSCYLMSLNKEGNSFEGATKEEATESCYNLYSSLLDKEELSKEAYKRVKDTLDNITFVLEEPVEYKEVSKKDVYGKWLLDTNEVYSDTASSYIGLALRSIIDLQGEFAFEITMKGINYGGKGYEKFTVKDGGLYSSFDGLFERDVRWGEFNSDYTELRFSEYFLERAIAREEGVDNPVITESLNNIYRAFVWKNTDKVELSSIGESDYNSSDEYRDFKDIDLILAEYGEN